jgi:hypothetical protein
VLGLLLRLLLMQLLACWLLLLLLLAGNQAGAATPAGTHPCTIAHARGPSPLCLCSSFLAMEVGPVSRRFSHLISWLVSSLRVHDHKLLFHFCWRQAIKWLLLHIMAQQLSITKKGNIEMRYPPEPPQINRLILFLFLLLELYQDELKSSLHAVHDSKAS